MEEKLIRLFAFEDIVCKIFFGKILSRGGRFIFDLHPCWELYSVLLCLGFVSNRRCRCNICGPWLCNLCLCCDLPFGSRPTFSALGPATIQSLGPAFSALGPCNPSVTRPRLFGSRPCNLFSHSAPLFGSRGLTPNVAFFVWPRAHIYTRARPRRKIVPRPTDQGTRYYTATYRLCDIT